MANPTYYRLPLGFRSDAVSGRTILRTVKIGGRRGVNRWAKLVFDQSQREVPKESRALMESGGYDAITGGVDDLGSNMSIVITYGGPGIPYAARIHEERSWKFKTPGTKAGYLGDPLKASTVYAAALLADHVQAALAARFPRL